MNRLAQRLLATTTAPRISLTNRVVTSSFVPTATATATAATRSFSTSVRLNRSARLSNHGTSLHGTTILAIRKGKDVVMIGDGQVTAGGNTVLKANAKKVRTLSDGKVMCGFAGSTADAFTLVERLEAKLEEHPGQLMRACVELAKAWRTDRFLRHLNAELIAADRDITLILTGVGDVIEPSDDVAGTGSGSPFAVSASRALMDQPHLSALDVATKAMNIAADMCVFTNRNFVIHSLENAKYKPPTDSAAAPTATATAPTPTEQK